MPACIAADELLDQLVSASIVHGDKGYDTDAIRRKVESKGAAPNIPPKVNRRWKNGFSPYLYSQRNAIERMFSRMKDFRRIATRYDRLARNFLAANHMVAAMLDQVVSANPSAQDANLGRTLSFRCTVAVAAI